MLHNHRGKKFQAGMGRYALLYIDCNAYEPALRSMQHFWEFLMPGGLIAIDEKLQGDESSALIDFASEKDLRVERLGSNEVPMVIVKPSWSPTDKLKPAKYGNLKKTQPLCFGETNGF